MLQAGGFSESSELFSRPESFFQFTMKPEAIQIGLPSTLIETADPKREPEESVSVSARGRKRYLSVSALPCGQALKTPGSQI